MNNMTAANWRIMVVDDEANYLNLMHQILKDHYDLAFVTGGVKAIEVARKIKPDLILLDVVMPDIDGYETCRRLKADPLTAEIPVIFVTVLGETEDESQGFEVGGVDYIIKPVSPPIVRARVATHLELYDQQRANEILIRQKTAELEMSQRSAIFMLGEAGEYNDKDTGVHIFRMASYSAAIARAAGWSVGKASLLEMAAIMHDAGKIGIPDSILKKPAGLDSEEWRCMKTHSAIGHSILAKSDTPLFRMAADVALYHHERWDGSGYPMGLSGEAIPESARIVAIADVFDALLMKRPYKEAWPFEKAFDEIVKNAGSHFDPALTFCFINIRNEIRSIKEKWELKDVDKFREMKNVSQFSGSGI